MKRINPGAGRNGTEVGVASERRMHLDLKPRRVNLKKRQKYLLHVVFGEEYEAPNTKAWADWTVTVTVMDTGPGWVDERTLTFDIVERDRDGDLLFHPVWPRGQGWRYAGPARP